VYYFYAALNLGGPLRSVSFSVPTGNFGDIYAGYLARRMGLPINQLIIATNRNDILHRLISNNEYSLGSLEHTLSPSMDIMVSSNFERYLFDLFDQDAEAVTRFVTGLGTTAQHLDSERWARARALFSSLGVDDETTCEIIAQVYREAEFLIDPHTAIGVHAARQCNQDNSVPMITLATAHPVKFADAVEKAGLSSPQLPAHLQDLFERDEQYQILDNSIDAVTEFMQQRLC